MKSKLLKIALFATVAALALCLVGCIGSEKSSEPTGYFEEYPEMQSPDGVIGATQKMVTSTDLNGKISASYTYNLEAADEAQAKADIETYAAALTDDGFTVESADAVWTIAKDGASIGQMELDAEKMQLKVKLEFTAE